ncbi:MAG: hypothetical protein LBI87_03345, partial [Candidatus Accumulibacter sp.]|nr:hypothetical protein [Accumulibacter sp.]
PSPPLRKTDPNALPGTEAWKRERASNPFQFQPETVIPAKAGLQERTLRRNAPQVQTSAPEIQPPDSSGTRLRRELSPSRGRLYRWRLFPRFFRMKE